jgi:hypothetical protein
MLRRLAGALQLPMEALFVPDAEATPRQEPKRQAPNTDGDAKAVEKARVLVAARQLSREGPKNLSRRWKTQAGERQRGA